MRRINRRSYVRVLALSLFFAMASSLLTTPASAAPTDVVINEIMYSPPSDQDGDEFLELANKGTSAVDLSGWCFSGITLCLPAGTSIGGGGFLVVARDATMFRATYGSAPAAVYTGGLSNSGETLSIKDAGGAVIDSVTYADVDPWPVKADGLGPSLELIDSSLNNDDPLNWAASTAGAGHTAGARNSVARSGLGPRISGVAASPAVPAPNQAVSVTATIADSTSATLFYRVDFGAEQSRPMTANGGTFSASIPGAAAGHLIRYRIQATNAATTSRFPRTDDTIVYQGVVVAKGFNSAIPVFEWFIADTDYNAITSNPTADIERTAVLAYNGTVYDNVLVNIRGQNSQTAPKPSWKFEMPKSHELDMPGVLVEPVDEFAMQSDWSDRSHGRPLLSWDSYATAGVINAQVFPVRTQKNASFLGLYTYIDLFDGTWRDREGYSDKQFFKAVSGAFDSSRPLDNVRYEKKNPDDEDYAPLRAFLNGVGLSGNAQRDYLLANANIPQMLNYAAVTAIVQHTDSSTKNFYLAQDPENGRWDVVPWDLDHTFGNTCCGVNSPFVTPAEPGDQQSALMTALLAVPEWRDMYFRRLRSLVNEVLAQGRLEAVYDAKVGPAAPEAALDFAAWPYGGTNNFSGKRTQLFQSLNARRSAFANDSRLPGNQSAAPNIVINEIQHSPVAGDDAEFLELYNPSSSEAVDLSGWSITDGIDLQIQPGTVILPGKTMVFVANDPTFRATYGSTVFVGGTYGGGLSGGETLTLKRRDGSTADAVTYGGTGWPSATGGPSLELGNPAADNNVGSNWALSSHPGGSPGAANGSTVTITPPSAPTQPHATAGNTSATVTWVTPGSTGGSSITGYLVRVLDAAGQEVGAPRPTPATPTSLVVTGLTNGTAYRFQIAAVNNAGTGAYSALTDAVTPSAGATVPGAPVIRTALQGASGGSLTAIAQWGPPGSTGGSAITGYQLITLRMSSSAENATVLSTTTSRVIGPKIRKREVTLAAGNYRFQVVALNAIGAGPPSARSNNVVPR